MDTFSAIVRGRVQGVGYRYFVIREAGALGLSGYAKNLMTGEVEVAAEGRREDLESLLAALRKGPPMSHVAGVDVEWSSAETPRYRGFGVGY